MIRTASPRTQQHGGSLQRYAWFIIPVQLNEYSYIIKRPLPKTDPNLKLQKTGNELMGIMALSNNLENRTRVSEDYEVTVA